MSFVDSLTARLPGSKKETKVEYYFALNIGLSRASSTVWSVTGNTLDIIGQHTEKYADTEDLIEKANIALDKALGAFEVDPSKILFGIPDGWLMDDNLKEPYLKLLRRMLKEYGLEPLAYVASSHALSHYLQKLEGGPATAVLLEIDEFMTATVVQGGKVLDTKATKRTDDLYADVEKLLLGFHGIETLPSKVLLYSLDPEQNLNKVKDQLMSFPWMQKLPFLHLPKVDMMPENSVGSALVYAGATEIDPNIDFKLNQMSLTPVDKIQSLVQDTVSNVEQVVDSGLGFIAGDIMDGEPEEELSFAGGIDQPEVPLRGNRPQPVEDQAPAARVPVHHPSSRLPAIFERVTALAAPLTGMLNSEDEGRRFKSWMIAPIVLVVILLGAYLFLVKAQVTVLVDPKILEKDAQVIADPNAKTFDQANNIIPGTVIEDTVTGNAQGTATGQKQIGDPAKGTVIIYNATSQPIHLSQGTVIVSGSGLKFTLDTSADIASKSASAADPPSQSAATNITASAIGPDSNLAAGTSLNVGSYASSDVVAKVDQALAGGTSKNVTVVTADDQKKAQAQLTDDLKQKAISDVQGKLSADQKLSPDALSVVDNKISFSKNVNDQASDFTVTATFHFKGTSYKDSDLKTILGKLVETNVPDGYELNLQETETQADISKIDKDGKVYFLAKFKAKLLPKLNTPDLKSKIKGKSAAQVADILKGMENVVGSDIKFTPSLPGPLARIPLLDNNITITVSPK